MFDSMEPLDFHVSSADVVAEIKELAREVGTNSGGYPGLVIYRYEAPAAPIWEEVSELHLCVIMQGRKCITMNGIEKYYDPFSYLAVPGDVPFRTVILEASPAEPFLSFGLQLDPDLVRQVSAEIMEEQRSAGQMSPSASTSAGGTSHSVLSRDFLDAILRFLRSLKSETEKRVLAPAYLREIVFRALQAEQYAPLVKRAAGEQTHQPIRAAMTYAKEHLAEPLTVGELAVQAHMSTSAFSPLFREVTGQSPYQFIKDLRLKRARELLLASGSNITEISREVGYSSASHFINEFRDRHGISPRAFADNRSEWMAPVHH